MCPMVWPQKCSKYKHKLNNNNKVFQPQYRTPLQAYICQLPICIYFYIHCLFIRKSTSMNQTFFSYTIPYMKISFTCIFIYQTYSTVYVNVNYIKECVSRNTLKIVCKSTGTSEGHSENNLLQNLLTSSKVKYGLTNYSFRNLLSVHITTLSL